MAEMNIGDRGCHDAQLRRQSGDIAFETAGEVRGMFTLVTGEYSQ